MEPAERISKWRKEYERTNGETAPKVTFKRGWYYVGIHLRPWRASKMDAATAVLSKRPDSLTPLPMEREMSEMKDCPFCGSEATVAQIEKDGDFHPECCNQGCILNEGRTTAQTAIDDWNRRSTPQENE